MESLKFTSLSKEQLYRLDFACEIQPSEELINRLEPNVTNALRLVMNEECSDAEIDLAHEVIRNLSDHGKVRFITMFTQRSRPAEWFRERFKRVNSKIMPTIVTVFKNHSPRFYENARRRSGAYTGHSRPIGGATYVAKHDMPCSGGGVIKKGASFRLYDYQDLEHGAIDARVIRAVGGEVKVILFPDEMDLMSLSWQTSRWHIYNPKRTL